MLRTLVAGLLFFLLIPAAVFAAEPETYHIEEVTIQVKGLTQKQLLDRKMNFDLDKQFSSIEEMEKYVAGRKQVLVNMRIFDAVESTISEGSEPGSYKVLIFVDDAFTMLPLPYAKYDSNYGLKAGLKLFDKNLLGTLSDMKLTSFIAQTPSAANSWEKKQYFTELIWNNIPLFGSTLNSTTIFEIRERGEGDFYGGTVETSLLLKDLPLLSNKFSMRANISAEQLDQGDISQWGNPDYDINFSWSRLPFFGKSVTIGAKWDFVERDSDGIETYDINLDTTFHDQDLLLFDIDFLAGMEYRFSGNELPRTLKELYFGVRDSFSLPFSTRITSTTKLITNPWDFSSTRFVFTNAISKSLPFSLRFSTTPVLTVYTDNYRDAGLKLTNKLSRNRIDWIHNFRKGLSFSATNTLEYNTYDLFDQVEFTSSYNSLTSTSFIILGDWLNLGSRVSAFYAYNHTTHFMDNDDLWPAELMRGILDRTIERENEWSFGSVINTNATITFIDLDGTAELLASVFLDAGIFSTSGTFEDLELHLSGGVEGALIFDKFKSYPFNVTIGANLMDVYAFMNNEISSIWDIEYEILMSLELFY
jgi:hypothetical protein